MLEEKVLPELRKIESFKYALGNLSQGALFWRPNGAPPIGFTASETSSISTLDRGELDAEVQLHGRQDHRI